MAAFDWRRREAASAAATDRELAVAPGAELPRRRGHLLALQRSVGNAAVSGSLHRARRGLGRRDRKLPDDPHSLSDVSGAAGDILMDMDTVSVVGRPWYFKNPRVKARAGYYVETRFGGDMAAEPGKEAEKALRDGLGSVGMIKFGLDADRPKDPKDDPMPGSDSKGPRRPPSTDLTQIEEMDLTQLGGQDGRYRFTAVVRASGKRTDVDLIVELLGPRRAALMTWDQLGPKRQKDLEGRFRQFSYKRAQDESEDVLKWSADQWARLLQAIEQIPEDLLRGVTGIVWERAHSPADAPKEAGHYETVTGLKKGDVPTRRLQLMDTAFNSDTSLIETVAHEIGHAMSDKPTETSGKAIAGDAEYRKAVKADGPRAITKYGDTSSSEHFAEAFGMFIAEPATLKALRPNVFAFFEKQKAAAGKKP